MISIGAIYVISKQNCEKFKNKATKGKDIEWIPVSEKLPEIKDKVLVAMQVGDISLRDEENMTFQVDIGRFHIGLIRGGNVSCAGVPVASFRTSLDYITIPGKFRKVVAWAPLPEEYKEVLIDD